MIASLVVTLKPEEGPCFENVLKQMQQRPGIETGRRFGVRLPLTIEAASMEEIELLTQWVQDLDGVLHVDVVFASFEPSLVGE